MAQVGTAFERVGSRKGAGNLATGDSYETRVYQVDYDDTNASSIDARNATGVPAWGATLSGAAALIVLEKEAAPDPSNQKIWIVTVTYRVPSVTIQLPQPNATTHKWQVIKSVTPFPVEVPVTRDLAGNPVVNVLGEPITPTPTRVIYDEQLNISFLTDRYDRTSIDACKGSLNGSSLTFTIAGTQVNYGAGTLLFNGWPLQEQYDVDGRLIASQQYQFLYKAEGWISRFPNISTGRLQAGGVLGAGGTNNNYASLDGYDGPAAEPHYIDAFGGIAPSGSAITTSSFNFYQTASFLTLLDGLG